MTAKKGYVHGYTARERERLVDQATTGAGPQAGTGGRLEPIPRTAASE